MSASTPPIHILGIAKAFNSLSSEEKHYAHYMARCSGDWSILVTEGYISQGDCNALLDYAAIFLSNIGNYYGSGDQKFTPSVPSDALEKLSKKSPRLQALHADFVDAILTVPPYGLGFPSNTAQSAYYPGSNTITQEEIAAISRSLEEYSIHPENTRIEKVLDNGKTTFNVLQASIEHDTEPTVLEVSALDTTAQVTRGDHSKELAKICESLSEAKKYAANETQKLVLSQYIESFTTGNLEAYRDSQRTWITDKSPRVENIFGFVEPYRDPYGVRSEFEGLVAIKDLDETSTLMKLVESSSTFIKRLPWATGTDNNGKGPFEKALFEPPDFTSIHSLAYCSSIIFPGINLPNYNDIRDQCGFKNVIIANRMSAEGNKGQSSPFVHTNCDVEKTFQKAKFPAYYWWVVLHELLGHGTGRMLREESAGSFNFDINSPPINPLNGEPIRSWYKPGQTWTGRFGDLATTVDEYRAELVGAYLMDDVELLDLFGYTVTSEITAADLTYNTYMQLGTDGLRGLANFNVKQGVNGNGCVAIDCDTKNKTLTVRVDRSKIVSQGKPALGRMLLHLHIYRCTADIHSCREYYEALSRVHDEYLEWRDVVLSAQGPKWVFVQANTFLNDGGEVILKEYEPTPEGVVQSWAERRVWTRSLGSYNCMLTCTI
ncbi:peptidase M49, dipeptidyl-peptidase III [Bimuria novae-zelandiae CBS 107.79]|uniref:Peptidase M49, dipeptidyl-peptidase III n=1 Tax=Bimuria novae-zelandiae CBS 107.79 TaxID=1447943 RepID=A0A6A5VR81_9PLEO|nr:peptidase M49, dipeptidyl-peptidase III [Bimuria novae-zelandiae CBS 107.79]